MNNSSLILALMFLLICSCSKVETRNTNKSTSLGDTRPKGQASVVDNVSGKNILQIAVGSEDHTMLVTAVEAAEIEHVLVNAGPLTVFAPVNSAFDALPKETVANLLKPENKAQLTNILTGHAAPGSYGIEALKKNAEKGRRLYMANGTYLEIQVEGEDVFVGGAKVVATIQTVNGIVNVVDKVILP